MPLVKLSRLNKGGDILINSQHIIFVETEAKSTTVHLTDGMLFSVEETPDGIADRIETIKTARIRNAIVGSGLGGKVAG